MPPKHKKLPPTEASMVISAANLRRWVGSLGMLLPIIVAVMSYCPLQESISSYYYIDQAFPLGSRNEFVGILWVIGIFLICYRGYEIRDFLLTGTAGLAAIATALWPCSRTQNGLPPSEILRGTIHLVFAGIFLSCLAVLILFQFTKTNPRAKPTARKRQRNLVYYSCGSLMVLSLVILLVYKWLTRNDQVNNGPWPVFCLESVAVFAFGFAWLVKGDTLWRDEIRHRSAAK